MGREPRKKLHAEIIFDTVFIDGSLHKYYEPARIFDEIHRVLKPGENTS